MLFAVTFVFSNCKKDNTTGKCGGNKYYHNLSASDKTKVPYSGTDTLVFVSNNEDTAVCLGQGKKQFYVTSSFYANPDCPPNTDYYEANSYLMASTNSNFQLNFTLYKDDGYGLPAIHVIRKQTDFRLSLVHINYQAAENFIDSLKVRNVWYKRATVIWSHGNPQADKLYYNQEFGIIKIQNADSTEIWELNNN